MYLHDALYCRTVDGDGTAAGTSSITEEDIFGGSDSDEDVAEAGGQRKLRNRERKPVVLVPSSDVEMDSPVVHKKFRR